MHSKFTHLVGTQVTGYNTNNYHYLQVATEHFLWKIHPIIVYQRHPSILKRHSQLPIGLQDLQVTIRPLQAPRFSSLFTQVQLANKKREQQRLEQQQRQREFDQAYAKMMEEAIPRQGVIAQPCIPLVDDTVIDVDKTSLVGFTLKVRPGGGNDHTYKKSVRIFSSGTPTEWIDTIRDLTEIWTQNLVNGPTDRAAIVGTILRDEALAQFEGAIEEAREPAEEGAARPALTLEMVDAAIKAVSAAIFPHRALETQKLWMRRHMKKPMSMKYRTLQARVQKMNCSLPLFPNATNESKFSARELLEILEFSLPATWRSHFDLKGYVPSQHNKERLLKEAEAIERKEAEENQKKRRSERTNGGNSRSASRRAKKKAAKPEKPSNSNQNKFCSEHGWGNHASQDCWSLHPELKPEKFRDSTGSAGKKTGKANANKTTTKKEINAMVQKELYDLIRGAKGSSKKTAGKSSKKARKDAESDSDESLNHLESEDGNTPMPSDDDEDMLSRIKAYAKKANAAQDASMSEDE